MDPASLAMAFVANQTDQTQIVLAERMIKLNADQQSAMAQMLAASAQQASLPAGVGRNLDIAA
jgi:hypothetical protein